MIPMTFWSDCCFVCLVNVCFRAVFVHCEYSSWLGRNACCLHLASSIGGATCRFDAASLALTEFLLLHLFSLFRLDGPTPTQKIYSYHSGHQLRRSTHIVLATTHHISLRPQCRLNTAIYLLIPSTTEPIHLCASTMVSLLSREVKIPLAAGESQEI